MLTKKNLFVLWCVVIFVILWIAVLPNDSPIHHFAVQYDSNRWLRFCAYAAIVAIPFSSWRTRSAIAFSLLPALTGMTLELWQMHIHGILERPNNVTPDLFGIAAGVLLGLNFRVMRKPGRHSIDEGIRSSESETE